MAAENTKKMPGKKASAKKAAPKETATKSAGTKKTAAKKHTTKKAAAKKATARQTSAKGKPPVTPLNEAGTIDIGAVHADCLAQQVGGEAIVRVGDVALTMTVMSCKARPQFASPFSERTPFNLILRGEDGDKALNGDGTYRLEMPPVGILDGVLITRIIPPYDDNQRAYYQVIFN